MYLDVKIDTIRPRRDWHKTRCDELFLKNFRVARDPGVGEIDSHKAICHRPLLKKTASYGESYAATNAGTVVWRKFSTDMGTRPVKFFTVGVTIA